MTIEKTSNGYLITDIIDGYLVKKLFIFYSRKNAVQSFKKIYKLN